MSRISISRRLDRIRDILLPPGTMAWRVSRLDDEMAEQYRLHRERVDRINLSAKNDDPGELYRRLIDGELEKVPMPSRLAEALGLDQTEHRWPIDTPIEVLDRAYSDMIDPERSNEN